MQLCEIQGSGRSAIPQSAKGTISVQWRIEVSNLPTEGRSRGLHRTSSYVAANFNLQLHSLDRQKNIKSAINQYI